MPTYEFRCPEGHEFEKFYRSIAGAPREVHCPICGKIAERELSAGAGLVFKGSGFYITDYGKDGKKPQTPPPAEGGGGGDTAGKTEPAANPETKPTDAKAGNEAKPAAAKSAETPASKRKSKSE